MQRRTLRGRAAILALVLGSTVVGCLSLGVVGSAARSAHAARTTRISEHANLYLDRKSGGVLYEHGTTTGTLTGPVSARIDTTNLFHITGTVKFSSRAGSLTVKVTGRLQTVKTITGSLKVKSGTGRYRGAHGGGTFTGTANRRTWHVIVDATGTISTG